MASTDVVDLIVSTTASFFVYMLPIIAVMSGITFMVSFLLNVTLGFGRRTFKA